MSSAARRAVTGSALAAAVVIALGSPAARATEEEGVGRPAVSDAAVHCLAQAMYWEGRGEGREGMIAIGSVVLNRVKDEEHPESVCAVVREGGESPPCAFSFWCDGRSDEPDEDDAWAEARALAREMLAERPPDPTRGAVLFHSDGVQPDWAADFEATARIGSHIFYR